MQRCASCQRYRFHPREMCPHCRSMAAEWRPVSGRGLIFSKVVCHPPVLPAFQDRVPYAVVLVELEEDPNLRLVGNVLDVPPEVGFERTGRTPQNTRKSGTGKRGPGGGQFEMFNGATPDAIERRPPDFHRLVRALFRELPSVYPAPVVLIDAARGPDEVFSDVQEAVSRAFS